MKRHSECVIMGGKKGRKKTECLDEAYNVKQEAGEVI